MRPPTRREFLFRTAAVPASAWTLEHSQILKAMPQAESNFGKVKIRDIQTTSIQLRYPTNLVRIVTDAGLDGYGEAFQGPGIVPNIEYLKRFVIGEDPLQVDYLWTKMIESTGGYGSQAGSMVSSISGIETALWDLAGKILKVPVYVLLGGRFRDALHVYHDTGSPRTADPRPWVEEALRSKEYGFKSMKFDLDWENRAMGIAGKPLRYRREVWNRMITSQEMSQWIRILEEIIKALGPGYDVAVD